MNLGKIGIWASPLRRAEPGDVREAAAELERMGFGALWFPGGGAGVFERCRELLDATSRIVVATGIVNVWAFEVVETSAAYASLARDFPDRFLLGLGVSHAVIVDRDEPGRYQKPLAKMREYLDALDAASPPVPKEGRALAALGPAMLRLAAERSAAAHPYLVPPEHTRFAREVLGQRPVLAPEQAVVFEADPSEARRLARQHLNGYLSLPNYANNWYRLGFTPDDTANGGSDRLVDALVAWGDDAVIRGRIEEHLAAGADHVCVQVITAEPKALPRHEWRRLAELVA